MDIPQDVQDKLKCSVCDEFLSCGPVYKLHETNETICGRCSQQPEQTASNANKVSGRTRNSQYEATASLLAFPCAFTAQGCQEKVLFSRAQPAHELNCKFRPLICPVVPRGSCDYIGPWPTLMEHCNKNHESNILENKCNSPIPDLTASNLKSYLITAFNFLFLLQIKVCVASGRLFHSVRMFGDPKFVDKFSFTLEVEGNNTKFSKLGSVLHAGILAIQEPTAICTTINHLLGILDGKYNGSKFTITIQTSLNINCVNCLKNIDFESNSIFCEECAKQLVKCKLDERYCSFRDINKYKCWTHENLFCEYQTKCYYCKMKFVGGSFIKHLISSNCCRAAINSNIDSVVRVIPNNNSQYYFILFSSISFGTIICENYLSNSKLYQYLYTSIPSHELKNFKCSIEFTDPNTKVTQLVIPQNMHNNYYDWYVKVTNKNFPK